MNKSSAKLIGFYDSQEEYSRTTFRRVILFTITLILIIIMFNWRISNTSMNDADNFSEEVKNEENKTPIQSHSSGQNDLTANISQNKRCVIEGYQYRYENKKLSNPFVSHLGESSESLCWKKCCELDAEGCNAISYKNGECLLYKSDYIMFQAENQDDWVTISLVSSSSTSSTSTTSPSTTTSTTTPVESLEKVYLNRSQIHGFYLAFTERSEKSCWTKCVERTECIAISYGSEEGRCHLTKKGEYQIGRYDKWVTIYKENEGPSKLLSNANFSLLRLVDAHLNFYIGALAILHNGDLVSSGDTKIKIWNNQDGSLKHTLTYHSNQIRSLIVLHNGNLVSASEDKKIIIWNQTRVERTLTDHTNSVMCLTLLPNTDFASASYDGEIKIWSSNGELKKTFKAHNDVIWSLITLQNGYLASGSFDNTIKVWDREGNLTQTLVGHTSWVMLLAQLDNGLLVSGSRDTTLRVWNIEKGKQLQIIYTTNNYWYNNLAVHPNGDLIYVNNDGVAIRSADQLSSGSEESKLIIKGGDSPFTHLAVYSNGDIVTSLFNGLVKIWKRQQF